MDTGAVGSLGRLIATAIDATNDHKASTTNHGLSTRQGRTRSTNSKREPCDDRDGPEATDQHQNPHPACNPDFRWPR